MSSEQNNPNDSDEELDFHDEPGGYHIGDIYIPPPPPPPKYSGDNTGVRLVITNIENINFKSYAGNQVLGPFHKSFSSIVGPNGSGKSNVIDSMLFVFGYRAQKLRSKKLSVLIHNSDDHPNLQSCEVKVHFALIDDKGGDEFNIVPNSKFIVSRTASKDNSSHYYIDNKKVQFKDVSQLLQSHGIDLRYNRFLILQGEVEQIALMKPKAENENDAGMLEFLEDIIGCTRLKAPLYKLQLKVEECSEQRAEKLNRVRVVEKEMHALEEPKNEAIKYIKIENDMALKKNQLYQFQKIDAEEAKKEAFEECERAQKIYQEALDEINKIVQEGATKEEEKKNFSQEYFAQCKAVEEYQEAFKDLERKDMQTRETIKHTKTKGKKLVAERDEETKKLDSLKNTPDTLEEELSRARIKKENLEKEKVVAEDNLKVVMGQIKEDTAKLQEEKDLYESELLSMQKTVTDSRSKKELAHSELDLYISRERTEKSRLDQMKFKFEGLCKEIEEKTNAISTLKQKIPTLEKELNTLKALLSENERSKQNEMEEHRQGLAKLSELNSNMQTFTTRNKVLQSLMDQKRRGTLHGILGRLGDLGAIDKKYDVAISTACGTLDNIVVDTIDNAQKCVQYLKDNNIGIGTFLALDKIQHLERHMHSKTNFPERALRLFDLVQMNDERVKVAFYFGLRDTLVAKDLDQATLITRNSRFRVVTLDGKLVELSGAMSGGGRPISGKMGSSISVGNVSAEEVQELENKNRRIQEKIAMLNEKGANMTRQMDQLSCDLDTMNNNLPKFTMEVKSKIANQTDFQNRIKELEHAVKEATPDPKQIKSLEKKFNSYEKEYETINEEAVEIENKIEKVNSKIKDIMDKNVGTVKKHLETVKKDIDKVDKEITKKSVDHKTSIRNIEKSESKLKSLEEEIEESSNLIEKLREEMKVLEKDAAEVTQKFEEANEKKDQMTEHLNKLQSAINKLKGQETKLTSENIDAKHEVDKLSKVLKEKDKDVQVWVERLGALELQKINESDECILPVLSSEELGEIDDKTLKSDIDNLGKDLKSMKPNMSAIKDYNDKEALFVERSKELAAATEKRDNFKKQHEQLKSQRLEEFRVGFTTITYKLKEMYRMITSGGDAELEWSDSLDPFSEGINFSVRPNKKSWKRISNLSGGEKTLSSLALIFALHYYKPSPLYVMDEIDAALDFKNVSIVANYIKERTRNTQFIIISLRNNMYELADRLVGIYKTHNCTKSVTFNPDAIESKRNTVVNRNDKPTQTNNRNIPPTEPMAVDSIC